MTLDRGSRDDTTARPPVSTRFLRSLPSPPSPTNSTVSLSLSFSLLRLPLCRPHTPLSSTPSSFPPSSMSSFSSSSFVRERRQVGIRAAVNSPAPLSALMSLLLFALLNAIRAYSVSLSPPLGPLLRDSPATLLVSASSSRAATSPCTYTCTRFMYRGHRRRHPSFLWPWW